MMMSSPNFGHQCYVIYVTLVTSVLVSLVTAAPIISNPSGSFFGLQPMSFHPNQAVDKYEYLADLYILDQLTRNLGNRRPVPQATARSEETEGVTTTAMPTVANVIHENADDENPDEREMRERIASGEKLSDMLLRLVLELDFKKLDSLLDQKPKGTGSGLANTETS